jgi:hypothetical protein
MMMDSIETLRFPVGRFQPSRDIDPSGCSRWIDEIEKAPRAMRDAVAGLNDPQLDTPYRPEGWTVRQVVHHLADSHINSIIRMKFALTEDEPTIKPYDEVAWAQLPDSCAAPVDVSLRLLDALHERWVYLLRSLPAAAFDRAFIHPENGCIPLSVAVAFYAWHGRHHVAHITSLRYRKGW